MNIYFVISYSEPNSNRALQFLYEGLSVNIFSRKMQPWFYWVVLAVGLMCHTCCSQQHPKDPGERAVGLHCLQGLQGLYLPSFKTKERTPSQRQRHQLFHGWGIVQVWSRIPEQQPIPGATTHSACSRHRHDRATGMSLFALTERRKLPVIGEIDFRLTHRLPGKLADGTSSLPFEKLSWWGYYDLKIRAATSWGADKYVERSVMWVGYRRSRLSRGYTESKRIAIWWPDHTEPTAQKWPLI